MHPMQDTWNIRHEFARCSRWRLLGLVFRDQSTYFLADIVLGLSVSLLLMLAGLLQSNPWTMVSSLVPFSFAIKAFVPAFRNLYPQPKDEIGLDEKYRKDFQYYRFRLFTRRLNELAITPALVKELGRAIQLESELVQAHPPAATRPAVTIQLTLAIGLIAALASIERFWLQGFIPIALAILTVSTYITVLILNVFPPSLYYEKELALFLEWYCVGVGVPTSDAKR